MAGILFRNTRNMSDLKGKLRVLDPWFDPIEEIRELYDSGPTKQIAQQYTNLISEHVAPPYVFAVNGAWGGGKTTFLRFLCDELETKGYNTLWFNPWEYEGQGDVVLALQKQMAAKFQGILGKTLKEMGVFGWAFVGAGLDSLCKFVGISDYDAVSKIVDDADKAIKSKEYGQYKDIVQKTKEDFRDLTQQVKKKTKKFLVVFLDDLDRCFPDNALRILEALKNLFVVEGAQVVFLCGIDTGVAKQFIRSRYQGLESDFAINYFKKIFNHTIELPHVPPDNLKQGLVSYIGELFSGSQFTFDSKAQLDKTAEHILRLSNLAGNRSLRSIFNVIDQYFVMQVTVGRSVDDHKILSILFLKEKWHGFYEQMVVEAKKFDGTQTELRTVLSLDILRKGIGPRLQSYLSSSEINLSTTVAELNELSLL